MIRFLNYTNMLQESSCQVINSNFFFSVEGWSQKFGAELWVSLSQATRRESIQGQYDNMPQLSVSIFFLFLLLNFAVYCLLPNIYAKHQLIKLRQYIQKTDFDWFICSGTKCLKNQPCDVIKIREMRGKVGMKTPKKEMDNHSFL